MARVEVRPFRRQDAGGVAELYNRYGYGPGVYGYPLTADDVEREMVERGTVLFLVAEHESGRIVGTMSFHPVSGQKAAPPGAIWGGSFFIHPEFRLGQIPAQLFTRGLEFLVDAGYYRIDTEVSPTNLTAIALYKRVGFHRTTGSLVDGDDYLEMVNYVPYLVRYFKTALQLENYDAGGLVQGWKNLLPPSTARSREIDSQWWHGREVVSYNLNIGPARLTCLIDLASEQVVSIDSNIFVFECYPAEDRWRVAPGEKLTLNYRYVNTSKNMYRLSLTRRWQGAKDEEELVAGAVLEPGGGWQGEAMITAPGQTGRLMLENHLHLEEILPDRINRFHFPIILEMEVEECRGRETSLSRPPVPPPWEVRARTLSPGWQLENLWLAVRVDGRTGHLDLVDQSTGHTLVREPWPEVGPPFPGGFKRPARRPLRLVELKEGAGRAELVLESPANVWWWRDGTSLARHWPAGGVLRRYTLQRRFILGSGQLLVIQTRLLGRAFAQETAPAGAQEETTGELEYAGFFLRTFPWANGRLLDLTVPLKTGLFQAPVLYEEFPFLVHDYEFLRPADLPLNPADYAAPWSAFSGEGMVAGLIWPGAGEVRFGLHWMPSVLYSVQLPAAGEIFSFPDCYYYGGPGDYRAVARCWELLAGKKEFPDTAGSVSRAPGWTPVFCQYAPVLALAGGTTVFKASLQAPSNRPREGRAVLLLPAGLAGGEPGEEQVKQGRVPAPGGEPPVRVWDFRQLWSGAQVFFQQIRRRWEQVWPGIRALWPAVERKGLPGKPVAAGIFPPGDFNPPEEREIPLQGGVSWLGPQAITYPLTCSGDPGRRQVTLIWREGEGEGEVRWPVPVLLLGRSGKNVQVQQHRELWRVDNGFLQFTLAPDFDGALIQLKAAGRQWLHTGYPKRRSLGRCPFSTGGAKFFPVSDSRDWLVTLSGEEVPWGYGAEAAGPAAGDLPWQGILLEGKNGQGEWKEVSVRLGYFTLPESPVILALAEYGNNGSRTVSFD
ncbi:MAG TPA: GNAT family N-acetyltransferase, partial [Desulfotomaculum sp.]|nr:GNAT family N-acetyltransferase [Desulfotomaculum sp.]